MEKIRVLVADDIEETRNVVKKILSMEDEFFEVVGEAANGEEVLKLIPVVKPQVVLMDINMPVLNGLEATERISNLYPAVIVIIMSVQGENEYLKKAMFHGAKEYIIKPFNYDSLIDTIKATYERNKDRIPVQVPYQQSQHNAKVISFFSSKGGVGKSVLALNTAITLTKTFDKRVLLIDMDLQFGDISMLVNEYNHKTLLDVIDDGQLDSYESAKPYLFNYYFKLQMLLGPKKPEAAEYIGKESIEKLIKIFKQHYDFIIVDTGVNFSDSTLYVLDQSDTILFISTMEIVALKNTKLGLGVMQSLGYDKNKVKLVINRFTSDYGISKGEVEEVFKDGIFSIVPDEEKTVCLSVNQGIPFCSQQKYNRLKIGKAIDVLCTNLNSLQR
jgi:pilus assembly protein CpaE